MIVDNPEQFALGRVVSRTFSVLGRNWLGFGILAGVLTLPLFGIALLTGPERSIRSGFAAGFSIGQNSLGSSALLIVSGALYLAASLVLQAALVQATIADLNGERPQLGACLATGLRNFFPLLAILILYLLAMGFAFVLLIVPGFMVLCALCVAVPARVVEQTGILDSLGRSGDLTRGHRWKIFALFLLLMIVGVLIGIASGLGAFLVPEAARPVEIALAQWITRIVGAVLNSAGVASLYYELRLVKEGIGAQQLAAAFD